MDLNTVAAVHFYCVRTISYLHFSVAGKCLSFCQLFYIPITYVWYMWSLKSTAVDVVRNLGGLLRGIILHTVCVVV